MAASLKVLIATASAALICSVPAQAAPDGPTPPPPPPATALIPPTPPPPPPPLAAESVSASPSPSPSPSSPTGFIPQQADIRNVLGQSGPEPGGLLGMPDLSAYASNLMLGQNPVPAAPGAPGAAVMPSLSVFSPEYMIVQNAVPAAPGEGTATPGLAPNQDIPGTGRISILHRIYEMYQDGWLKGSLLGRQSPEEFLAQTAVATPPAVVPPPPAVVPPLPAG